MGRLVDSKNYILVIFEKKKFHLFLLYRFIIRKIYNRIKQ